MSQGERLAILVPCDLRAWVSMNFTGEGDTAVEGGTELVSAPVRYLWWYWMKTELTVKTGGERRPGGKRTKELAQALRAHPDASSCSPWRASLIR